MIRALTVAACTLSLTAWASAQDTPVFPDFEVPPLKELELDTVDLGAPPPATRSSRDERAGPGNDGWAQQLGGGLGARVEGQVEKAAPYFREGVLTGEPFNPVSLRGAEVRYTPASGEPFTVRALEFEGLVESQNFAIYDRAFDFKDSGPYVLQARGPYVLAIAGPAVKDPARAMELMEAAWAATGIDDLPPVFHARAQLGPYDVLQDDTSGDMGFGDMWTPAFEEALAGHDPQASAERDGDVRRLRRSSAGRLGELDDYGKVFGIGRERPAGGVAPALDGGNASSTDAGPSKDTPSKGAENGEAREGINRRLRQRR
ncbi:MAG: hypothetical protein R3F62_08675 [Planctomycetota bacterium]